MIKDLFLLLFLLIGVSMISEEVNSEKDVQNKQEVPTMGSTFKEVRQEAGK